MTDEDVLEPQVEETDQSTEDEVQEEKKKSLEEKLKEVIDVRVEDLAALRKKMTISIPREAVDEHLEDQYDELRREAQVPGFRKGRAPHRLLEKRFGNEVNETVVQQFVSAGYLAAIEKTDLKVLGDPLIWAKEEGAESETLVSVDKAIDLIKLPSEGPVEYSCEVEVRPEFDLPELEGIPIEKPVVTISDDDVNTQIDRIRGMRGSYETLPDGVIEPDDVVIADIKMTSGETVLKEQDNVRLAARPQHIDGVLLAKLGEVLTGAKAGDVRNVSGQISDDYVKVEFRGKPADFEIKIREVRRLRLPELNEDFIQHIGFDSQQELREWVRNNMESRIGENIRRQMVGQVCRYLLDNTSFELPTRLSERQTNRIIARRMLDLYNQGVPPAEVAKLMDEIKTGAQTDAVRDLKLALIMEKLNEEYSVKVSEGEINARIGTIAQTQGRRFDRVRDELAQQGALANLYVQIRDEKIIDLLIDQAIITESELQDEEKDEESTTKREKRSSDEKSPKDTSSATGKMRPKRTPPTKNKDKDADDFADET